MLARNNCQLPKMFTNFKIRYKNTKIVVFSFIDSLVGTRSGRGCIFSGQDFTFVELTAARIFKYSKVFVKIQAIKVEF